MRGAGEGMYELIVQSLGVDSDFIMEYPPLKIAIIAPLEMNPNPHTSNTALR